MFKSIVPKVTLDGGKSGNTEETTSTTLETERYLMSIKERMLKDKRLSSGTDITESIRDGELSMLTNHPRFQPRDTIQDSDSMV
jgi:hypothetical protein